MKKQIKMQLFNALVRKTYILLGSLFIGTMLLIILINHSFKGSYITIERASIKAEEGKYWINALWEDEESVRAYLKEDQEIIWFRDASSNRHTGIIRSIQCMGEKEPKQYKLNIEVPEEGVKREFELPLTETMAVMVEIKVKDVPLLGKAS